MTAREAAEKIAKMGPHAPMGDIEDIIQQAIDEGKREVLEKGIRLEASYHRQIEALAELCRLLTAIGKEGE